MHAVWTDLGEFLAARVNAYDARVYPFAELGGLWRWEVRLGDALLWAGCAGSEDSACDFAYEYMRDE